MTEDEHSIIDRGYPQKEADPNCCWWDVILDTALDIPQPFGV